MNMCNINEMHLIFHFDAFGFGDKVCNILRGLFKIKFCDVGGPNTKLDRGVEARIDYFMGLGLCV